MTDYKLVNPIRYNKHIRRKNNDLVAAMFAMYDGGKSLAEIAGVYKRSRQAVYDVFRTRGYQLRTKELKGLQILDGIKFTLMKGGYLRGTTSKGRMTMQKYVWQKYNGKVPVGYAIHHKDGNKENNGIKNLELVAYLEMGMAFNPVGKNQFSI